MRRLARDFVVNNKALPYRIYGGSFRQQLEHAFDPHQFSGRRCRRHPQAVLFKRACGHHPEFYEVPRDDMEHSTLGEKALDRAISQGVQRMMRL